MVRGGREEFVSISAASVSVQPAGSYTCRLVMESRNRNRHAEHKSNTHSHVRHANTPSHILVILVFDSNSLSNLL